MATKKKTPAQSTWTPQALAQLANAWLAAGNAPTQQMLSSPALNYAPETQTVTDPGTPEAPPTNPFLTAEQQQSLNQLFSDTGNQLAQLDQSSNDALVAAIQQIGDPNKFDPNDQGTDLSGAVNKGAMISRVNATDAAIARGLFQSSMRDADLADIEATRQMRRNFFRDQYASVIKANDTQRKNITDFVNTAVGVGYDPHDPNSHLGGTYGAMAIENAKGSPGAPGTPATIKTTPGKFNVAGAPAQATGKVKAGNGDAFAGLRESPQSSNPMSSAYWMRLPTKKRRSRGY